MHDYPLDTKLRFQLLQAKVELIIRICFLGPFFNITPSVFKQLNIKSFAIVGLNTHYEGKSETNFDAFNLF